MYNPFDDIWKPIAGFPGYSVSISGVVASGKGKQLRLLKPGHCGTNRAYPCVVLRKDDKSYMCMVHRLVAEAFIPNPDRLPLVRHLDGDPDNNDITNLAWGTTPDNVQDSIGMGTFHYPTDEDRAKAYAARRKPINAYNSNGNFVETYESATAAAKSLGVTPPRVSQVLNGQRPHTRGYRFELARKEDINAD